MIYVLIENGNILDAQTSKPKLYDHYLNNCIDGRQDAEIWYVSHPTYYKKQAKPPMVGDKVEFSRMDDV